MTTQEPIFLVLPTGAVGGAEKRFAGLWQHLRRTAGLDVRLVLQSALLDQLVRLDELPELRSGHGVEPFDAGHHPRLSLLRALRTLAMRARHAVFHFILVPPTWAQPFTSKRTLFTIPVSTLTQYNWRGFADVCAGVVRATHIDVLDSTVCAQLQRLFAFKKESFSVTPSSFVDVDHYRYTSVRDKTNLVAFSGLFSDEKQAPHLVACLPVVDRLLKARGHDNVEFNLLGRNTSTPGVTEQCAELSKQMAVRAWYEPNPASVLTRAKVFLSLQKTTNYPSKSLLEALACGCLPIATDVGETRRIADASFARYVPRDFDAEQLASHIAEILEMPVERFDEQARTARDFVKHRFSVENMAAYYSGLYAQLAGA